MTQTSYAPPCAGPKSAGFTLIEMLIITVIIAVLAAIAIPQWQRWIANQRVITARETIRQGIRQAQTAAMTEKVEWRLSLRTHQGIVEWAIHADSVAPEIAHWQALHPAVMLHDADTTLLKKSGIYYVRFGLQGIVTSRLGTITLTSDNSLAQPRCVIVSTLLGATRKGEAHPAANANGRYCY